MAELNPLDETLSLRANHAKQAITQTVKLTIRHIIELANFFVPFNTFTVIPI
jgi:hypothetical protein